MWKPFKAVGSVTAARTPGANGSKKRTFSWLLRLVPLLVVATAALLLSGGDAVEAQEELPAIGDNRDLSLEVRYADVLSLIFDPKLVVRNNSSIPIRDVRVRVTTDSAAAGERLHLNRASLRSPSPDYDASSGIWTVDELGPGGSSLARLDIPSDFPAPQAPDYRYFKVSAEIIASAPSESPAHLDNNQVETWLAASTGEAGAFRRIPIPNTQLSVDVDNRSPERGEKPVFTVEAEVGDSPRDGDARYRRAGQSDVVVRVALSEGLAFASTPSAPPGTSFSRTSSTAGVWRLGSGEMVPGTLNVPVQLSTDPGAAPPLNRRCLTAQIVASNPPPTYTADLGEGASLAILERAGPQTACLGAEKLPAFSDGRFNIRGIDCPSTEDRFKGVCREGETTRALAVFHYDDPGDPRGGTWYRAEDVIFLVDPVAHQNPGTLGDLTWTWSTGQILVRGHDDYSLPGVKLNRQTAAVSFGRDRKFSISNVDMHNNPGTVAVIDRYFDGGVLTLYEALNPDKSDKLIDNIDDAWGPDYEHIVVFSNPGVYKYNLGLEFTRKSDNVVFSVTGTLTFVVGHVSDLQVHDAGLHGTLPRGQKAYILRAENNLDGTVEQVEVALTGVPRGARAEVSGDGGSYRAGNCSGDLCEGAWLIGDLEGRDDRYNTGRSDGPTLTLLVDGNPDPITATITSRQTRGVTAGGQTYNIGVTDLDDSNSKDISVAVGTGRGEPPKGLVRSFRVEKQGQIAVLRWEPTEDGMVDRWPVSHYEVERNGQIVELELRETLYVDLRHGSSGARYRVRAVSDQDVPGPWTSPSGEAPQVRTTAPRDFTATVSLDGGRVALAWLPAATDGAAVEYYQLEWRQRTSDDWDCLRLYPAAPCLGGPAASATSAEDALPVDTEGAGRYYRIRAVFDDGIQGSWAETRAVDLVPEIPGNFTAALSDSGNAAVLTWTAPASQPPITGYIIDISESAQGDSRTNDRTVGGSVTTWTHTGLGAGDVKHYRVRARSSAGEGEWTEWQRVGTGAGAPGSLRAQANGPYGIALTWSKPSSRDVEVSHYDLEFSDTAGADGYRWSRLARVYADADGGLRYVDDSLYPQSTRHYRVRAWTVDPDLPGGVWSNVARATTTEAGPDAPLNPSIEVLDENRIRLTWEAPASDNAVRYNIEHSTDGEVWRSERTGHTGTCTINGQTLFCYTDTGLHSGTEHFYRVAGVNRSGVAGERSSPVWATTEGEPTETPGEPQDLRVTGVNGRQVSLAWGPPLDDGGSRVTGYEYRARGPCAHDRNQTCDVVSPTRVSGTSRTVTVPNVKGYYEFEVRALNVAGGGWWTATVAAYVDPQRTWRVTQTPSRLTVNEGGEATYRVRLTSDPGRPVMLALWWYGDRDIGNTLPGQQFIWLLPSNYQDPGGHVDPEWSYAWNVGALITVTADEDDDSDNGTTEIHNTIYYVPCADLGNPDGCVDDPDDGGVTAILMVTERDND